MSNGQQHWSDGAMTSMFLATLVIPLVGIIAGAVGLSNPARKGQGGFLLASGLGAGLVWLFLMR